MNGRKPGPLMFVAVAAAGLLLALLLLPGLIAALPGQVRGRLPEAVLRAITTPLPTALPPPLATGAAPPASLAGLLATPTATAAPSATPTRTAVPSATRRARTAVSPSPAATLTATPTPTPSATATATAVPLPAQTRINGLTVVPQRFNNCGPASLSVVLDYYGAPDTQADIAAVLKPHYDDRNVSPEELAAYVREHTGLEAAVYRGGDVELLRQLLAAGFPVLVEKGYEPNDWQGWMGHYLTLTGYDDEAGHFISLDTFLGPWDSSGRAIGYDELATYWAHFNHTFIVVHHPDEEPALAALLAPFASVEQMWQNAADAAAEAVAAQPDDAFAWFNLGASLTELGGLRDDAALVETAAAAFDQARLIGLPPRMLWYQFQPYEAYIGSGRVDEALALAAAILQSSGSWHVEETHYYQALAYTAVGEIDRARVALRNALQIRPGYPEAQALLDSLPPN